MLRFVLHKLINKKWMVLCLLIGNMLIMAVTSSNPIYTDAVLQRTLTRSMSQMLTQTNVYPARATVQTELNNKLISEKNLQIHRDVEQQIQNLADASRVPVGLTVREYSVETSRAYLCGDRATDHKMDISLGYLDDFDNHVSLVSGHLPSAEVKDGVIEAVASQQLLLQQDVLLGETIELRSYLQSDGETPYRLQIVGIYQASSAQDLFWEHDKMALSSSFIISEAVFDRIFRAEDSYPYGISLRSSWYLDYQKITPDQADDILEHMTGIKNNYLQTRYTVLYENISKQMSAFLPEASRLSGTLTVLQAPIFILLAAFIFMVSRQMMEMEENEIAVIKSRGAKKSQVVRIYAIQALLLAGAGMVLGYPLGYLMCQMIGSSNAFLEFVQRGALPVRFTWNSVLYCLGAGCAAWAAMTLPVVPYTAMSIVQHKVRKQAGRKAPWWQRSFLDVILLAVSLYALYSFHQQKAFLAVQMEQGGAMDPMLYFSSSLFILGAGLLGMRLAALLTKLIYHIGRRFWSPSLYAGFLRVIRTRNSQSFIMIFLVLTIALGIFNMASARSINGNAEQQIIYMNGCDVAVREVWNASSHSRSVPYIEPDFEKYRRIPGVESLTKVYTASGVSVMGAKSNAELNDVALMGINTREFGETANFDESLLDHHWFYDLNAMSQDPRGVLLSSSFRDEKGYREGDIIKYRSNGYMLQGVVCGFVDYWPGFAPKTVRLFDTGMTRKSENYLIVSNLSYLQSECGVYPYDVWMKMEGSSQPVYDFAAEQNVRFMKFRDTAADLIALKNESVFQGTNGVLTSNFIIVLLLCAVGFLIYWVLSIRSRELQFGIFRAMGMSMGEVIRMLLCEQALISGASILVGIASGVLATRLYLPLIQLAYSGSSQVLPIRMIVYAGDAVRLFAVVLLIIVGCMFILAWLISKIRIAQALKLGED